MTAGKWLFAAAMAVFGIQHFIYADFAATLVPALPPRHLFLLIWLGIKPQKFFLILAHNRDWYYPLY